MSFKDTKGFQKDLDIAASEVFIESRNLLIKIGIFVLTGVVIKTRVDTGNARNGWHVSTMEPGDDAVISNFQTQVNKLITLKLGQPVWISNSVFYIEFLENGSPTNDADQMLASTLREAELEFPDAA